MLDRRGPLLRIAAAIAAIALLAGLVAALLIEPAPVLKRALSLHGSASLIPADTLVQLGWLHIVLALAAYALAFSGSRWALPALIASVVLSALTHLLGGLSVSIGVVSLAQFVVYTAEGAMLALLLMTEPTRRAESAP